MTALIIVQLFMILLFLLFGYLIVKKEAFWLLSGFSSKSEEDKQVLIKNGYPQFVGRGMIYSSIILLIGLVLYLFQVPYMIELSWVAMIIYLFAHLLYASKLDKTKHRKRNIIVLVITILFTFGILTGVSMIGMQPNHLSVSENHLHISGMYGVEWPLDEITDVELVDTLPTIQVRTNGFSFANRLKGNFRLEELGHGKLFLYRNHPPFIYIEKGEDYLFINSKDPEETRKWFSELEKE